MSYHIKQAIQFGHKVCKGFHDRPDEVERFHTQHKNLRFVIDVYNCGIDSVLELPHNVEMRFHDEAPCKSNVKGVTRIGLFYESTDLCERTLVVMAENSFKTAKALGIETTLVKCDGNSQIPILATIDYMDLLLCKDKDLAAANKVSLGEIEFIPYVFNDIKDIPPMASFVMVNNSVLPLLEDMPEYEAGNHQATVDAGYLGYIFNVQVVKDRGNKLSARNYNYIAFVQI